MRVYLKMAIRRDGKRPEPYYWLTEVCEEQGNVREALHYYCRAIDAGPTFQRARKALGRLKQLGTATSCKFWIIASLCSPTKRRPWIPLLAAHSSRASHAASSS